MASTLPELGSEPAGQAAFDAKDYADAYRQSLEHSDTYWDAEVDRLDWIRRPTRFDESSFDEADFQVCWFGDGVLNVSANCLDRHLDDFGDTPAIIWEPDDPATAARTLTYRELHREVCRFANVLKHLGVKRGDRVTLYLPMIPEAAMAMLACARIGAIHSVVFGGFSPESIAQRIVDCDSTICITADQGLRGGKVVPLQANVAAAAKLAPSLATRLVIKTTEAPLTLEPGEHDYAALAADVEDDCPPEPMNAEDPLFILYTSGSTGKPKGVVHSSGGYLLWASLTHQTAFDYRHREVFWCAADIGWITGHSYIVYGPLANGATTLMFEGVPTWPTPARLWEVVDRHEVATLFTAPTVLRSLMREGDHHVTSTSRKSLRLLGSVGEPINPEAWRWFHEVPGESRCPIVDMWWQTETGGGMIMPLPGAWPPKPGSATLPFMGVDPVIVDGEGQRLSGATDGNLCIARSWPGQMRTVWNDHERFFQTYFSTFPGLYFTGDGCRRDEDGYYWITGRVDDVINVSGHRLGTAEIESALVLHPAVAEAAVVGFSHDLKGQGIHAYVILNAGSAVADDQLRQWVRKEIGPIATPDRIQFAPGLPKTRSGKIMRRILRKVAEGDVANLGDTSTLAEPGVVDVLVAQRVA